MKTHAYKVELTEITCENKTSLRKKKRKRESIHQKNKRKILENEQNVNT